MLKTIIIFLCCCCLSIKGQAQTHDINDSLKWVKTTNLVARYYQAGKTDSAILLAKYGQGLAASTFGKMHKNYVSSVNDLAFLYMSIKQYKQAETLYQEGLTIRKSLYGENHSEYWRGLNNLGNLYKDMDDLEKAEIYFSSVIETMVKYKEQKQPNYVIYLNNLAKVLEQKGKYKNAETAYLEIYSICQKTRIETDTDFLTSLNNLANIYELNANYPEAERLYKKALDICEKRWGNQGANYATFLNNLSSLYRSAGSLVDAESLQKKVLILFKKNFGEQHENYAIALNNLAIIYFGLANYIKAEALYNEAIDLMKRNNKMASSAYADAITNSAALYNQMGSWDKTENLLNEALNVFKRVKGTNHSDYALCLSSLALVKQKKSDVNTSIELLLEAQKIYENTVGESHFYYIANLNSLAALYQQKGNYELAEALYNKAIPKLKNTIGDQHPYYAKLLNNYGVLQFSQKKYKAAESLYNQSLLVKKKVYGETHIDYIENANDLAILFYAMNETDKLNNQNKYLLNLENKSQQILLSGFSETEKKNYLQQNNYMSDVFHSTLSNSKKADPKDYYSNMVAKQGWLLQGKQQLKNLSNNSDDTTVKRLLSEWQGVNNRYARAIQFTEERRKASGIDLDNLNTHSQTLEKQLIVSLPQFQTIISNTSITVKEVVRKLKKNEAVVHWVSFQYKAPEQWTDSALYAAYILLPNDTIPKFITVFEEKQLQQLLKKYHSAGSGRSSLTKEKTGSVSTDVSLYNLIWKPLLPHLKNATSVYNLPAGLLHKVSFAALTDSSNSKQLIDVYELHQLLTINELTNPLTVSTAVKSIALFGGADYDSNTASSSTNSGATAPIYRNATDNKDIRFSYLPGTKTEVEMVAANAKNTAWKTQSYTSSSATEDNFKNLIGDNAPKILHIATHGFYFPSTKTKPSNLGMEDKSAAKDFPLLRSGLVLSGANNYWGKDTILENNEDGIVTAQEISNLNLLNTDLVVLSACQTALGDINASEGVYGLQRAFKMAGAKKLLMSLWEVPDAETAELMQLFYSNVFKGDSYYNAFRKAQLALKAKYTNPTKWAGFVLVGE